MDSSKSWLCAPLVCARVVRERELLAAASPPASCNGFHDEGDKAKNGGIQPLWCDGSLHGCEPICVYVRLLDNRDLGSAASQRRLLCACCTALCRVPLAAGATSSTCIPATRSTSCSAAATSCTAMVRRVGVLSAAAEILANLKCLVCPG